MAFLKVYCSGEERTVFLGDEPVVVGRDQSCDILLKDLKASRQHCVIEPRGDGWRVRDLGSGNGTKVNGKRIDEPRRLVPDDVVQVGEARVLFAGEGVAVVKKGGAGAAAEAAPRAPTPARASAPVRASARARASAAGTSADVPDEGRPRRDRENGKRSRAPLIVGLSVVVLAVAAVFAWQMATHHGGEAPAVRRAYETVLEAKTDRDFVHLADSFLSEHGDSSYAAEIRTKADAARRRMESGTSARHDGYDAMEGLDGLALDETVAKLKERLAAAAPEHRAAVRAALGEAEDRLRGQRERFFAQIETEFRALVDQGEFARAREMWFFLVEQEGWSPIPQPFPARIVEANANLEVAASAARNDLLEECARAEAAFDFKGAIALLTKNLPRFRGTSVHRSLEERLAFNRRALAQGVEGKPAQPVSLMRVDVGKKMKALLAVLPQRDFRAVATKLRALADEAKKAKDRGYAEIRARTIEVESAADLHEALVAALSAGKLPRKQIARRWRVLKGDASGVTVRSGGAEQPFTWKEMPAELYLPLLAEHLEDVKEGGLGLVVAAHAVGGEAEAVRALALVGDVDHPYPKAVDRFIAARLRSEPVPEGGYVVAVGAVITRKEYLRRQEEARILQLRAQLDKALKDLRGAKVFAKLDRLRAKKDKLDEARTFALDLIFDEKKYFYPYRGTGRMKEYMEVQREVDRRVAAVVELWDDRTNVKVAETSDITKALKAFDEAAAELEKRLVDVDEEVETVAFLRSYLGKKFTVRNFYRDPEEWDLLRYSEEVMEYNPTVKGDIRPPEREQVRITNEYRMMFGRWPVRIQPKLVLSARGHCEEMSKLGYFGHFSPTPGRRTPYDRMRLAGYTYGASENCAMGRGDPAGAHYGWCHSSGHHRNLLMPPWTELGSGAAGRYWTQNFGQAPKWSKYDKKEDEADPEREWESWDDEGDGDSAKDDDEGFDYGDDDEDKDKGEG